MGNRHYQRRKNKEMGETTAEGLNPESLMFRDGRRRIDMVLAYEDESHDVISETEARKRYHRKVFQENLLKEGLELELENKILSFNEKTWFLKIHMPRDTETELAEIIGLKLPVKQFRTISGNLTGIQKQSFLNKIISKCIEIWDRIHGFKYIQPEPSFYESIDRGGGTREEHFLVKDRYKHFSPAQRSLLVMQILLRAKYDNTNATRMGIRRLLNEGTYIACFPLHEGRYDVDMSDGTTTDRRLLYLEWARPSTWYKKQPLYLIRRYFGDKVGLYFCWRGFYIKMLYAPAVVGTLVFIYGIGNMNSNDTVPIKEICDLSGPGNITLCPLCDKACKYQKLGNSCQFAKVTYLFDNPTTVLFSIFMSFWATTFLELWKRRQSVLRWEWDLGRVDLDEDTRPEFEASVKTFRINPVTREKEPYLSFWQKAIRYLATTSAVLFMISIVLATVLGTIIYRISMMSVTNSERGIFLKETYARAYTSFTAAAINLILIMILEQVYRKIALYLTNLESPRTQTDFEHSYTFKIFFFEFINFYSSLVYVAFFKGAFYDHPGDHEARKSAILKLKGDICDPAGCFTELCIQLAIIMVGKKIIVSVVKISNRKLRNSWRKWRHRMVTRDKKRVQMRWEIDYHLIDPGPFEILYDYLDMIIQYGLVTLFVAAFPLAPLFALITNIAEIKTDAIKMVTQFRRPLAERVQNIGAWYRILKCLTYTAVVSNAFVIAYTSEFIPRMVYIYFQSQNQTLVGYIEHSLSWFNTSDYKDEWVVNDNETDPQTCAYRGYRNPPDHKKPYGLSPYYWHVMAARLIFVVIFEHFVFALTGLMQFLIPDVPSELRIQLQREALIATEVKYKHERQGNSSDSMQFLNNSQSNTNTGRKRRKK